MNIKKTILIIVITLLTGIVFLNLGLFEKKTHSPNGNANVQKLPILNLSLLKKKQVPYEGVKRDVFTPIIASQTIKKTKINEKKIPAPIVSVQQVPVQGSPPPPKLPSQLEMFASQVKFIGFLEKGEGKTVFLTKGNNVFLVKKGDLIDNKFKVVDVTGNLIVLKNEMDGEEANVFLTVR